MKPNIFGLTFPIAMAKRNVVSVYLQENVIILIKWFFFKWLVCGVVNNNEHIPGYLWKYKSLNLSLICS